MRAVRCCCRPHEAGSCLRCCYGCRRARWGLVSTLTHPPPRQLPSRPPSRLRSCLPPFAVALCITYFMGRAQSGRWGGAGGTGSFAQRAAGGRPGLRGRGPGDALPARVSHGVGGGATLVVRGEAYRTGRPATAGRGVGAVCQAAGHCSGLQGAIARHLSPLALLTGSFHLWPSPSAAMPRRLAPTPLWPGDCRLSPRR